MGEKSAKVEAVLQRAKKWREEFEALRAAILTFPLTEELKWGQACYALDGKNVVLIHGFKEYCAVLFFKGALLKDAKHILATPGTTQAGRQMRFTGMEDVTKLKPALKAYVREAIEVEKAGLKVSLKSTEEFAVPAEFEARLKAMPALKKAFGALTPGRQRGYLYHFGQAKQAKTREARIEKNIPAILAGKGFGE